MWQTTGFVFVLGKCSLEIQDGGGKLRPLEVESLFHPILSKPVQCRAGLFLPLWLDGDVGMRAVWV